MCLSKLFQFFQKPEPENDAFQFFDKIPVTFAEELLPYLPYTDVQNLGDTCTVLRQLVDKNKHRLQKPFYFLHIYHWSEFVDIIYFKYYKINRHTQELERCEVDQSNKEFRIDYGINFEDEIIKRINSVNLRIEGIYYNSEIISHKLFETIQRKANRVQIDVQKFNVHEFCGIDRLESLKAVNLIEEKQLRMILENNPSIHKLQICCNLETIALVGKHYKQHTTLVEYKLSIPPEENSDPEIACATIESYFNPHKVHIEFVQPGSERNASFLRTICSPAFLECFKCYR